MSETRDIQLLFFSLVYMIDDQSYHTNSFGNAFIARVYLLNFSLVQLRAESVFLMNIELIVSVDLV